jgi:DNA-binding beta-propeller fold protein YncE
MTTPRSNLARISLALAAGLLTASLTRGDATPPSGGYAVQKTIKIGGQGRWDYVSVDPTAHRLYVTRSTHTQVIDTETGKVVLDVAGQQRSHGVAAAPAVGRGFITDGGAGTIVIFDLKTGDVLGNSPAADDADGLIFDPGTGKVLATCGDAGVLAVLDAAADPKTAKAGTVDLGGKPEFLAADGKGMAYVCVNDKNEIAVVDLKAMKVTARYPIGSGTKPTGVSIDPKNGRLFVGCRNQLLVVLDTAGGKVLAELPIGRGNDACGFDPGTGEAFASCGDGTLTVVKETSAGKFEVAQTVKTPNGARTLAVDPSTHTVYLPTAEFGPAQPGQRRPEMKADSFMIAVVGAAK